MFQVTSSPPYTCLKQNTCRHGTLFCLQDLTSSTLRYFTVASFNNFCLEEYICKISIPRFPSWVSHGLLHPLARPPPPITGTRLTPGHDQTCPGWTRWAKLYHHRLIFFSMIARNVLSMQWILLSEGSLNFVNNGPYIVTIKERTASSTEPETRKIRTHRKVYLMFLLRKTFDNRKYFSRSRGTFCTNRVYSVLGDDV